MGMIWESTGIPVLVIGKGWLALDKPAGITVHNASGEDLCSLAGEWVRKDHEICRRMGLEIDFDFNPIHRLDKETSGIILLAADRETFRSSKPLFDFSANYILVPYALQSTAWILKLHHLSHHQLQANGYGWK